MLFKAAISTALVFMLATHVIADASGLGSNYQILKPIANLEDQKAAISAASDVQGAVSAFVAHDPKVQNLLADPESYESLSTPLTYPIDRHFWLRHFPESEAQEYMTEALKAFFLGAEGNQKLSDGLISSLVEEASSCKNGRYAYELAPDIAMNESEYEIRIRFVAVDCSDKERIELLTYEAFREGSFSDPLAAQNAIIPQYARAELLSDMADFFQGTAQTC